MLHRMVRRAAALAGMAALLAGCGSAQDEAADALQERLDGLHEGVLEGRAEDPTLTGQAAIDRITDDPLHSSVEGDRITLVLDIGVRVEAGGGLFYESASIGACVLVGIQAGDDDGDRGSVLTAPVDCPDGTVVENDRGGTADTLTTDLEWRWDDVPEPEPHYEPCISGEVCDHGGG